MGAPSAPLVSSLVGRRVELTRLRARLADAAQGKPGVLLVHGEAGVGKTALVREACATFPGQTVWGSCVHFSTTAVPFAAALAAVDGWLSDADAQERREVLTGLDALGALLPSYGVGEAAQSGVLLAQLDAAVLRIAQRQPTVLVIDDLQWADPSTLDLLSFLVSGLRTQTLAVIATVRDEDRPDGHPVNPWLSDLRRMPEVDEMHLARLGPEDTADQVESLVGQRSSDAGLAARVHARSGGNPYLTELVVGELTAGELSVGELSVGELTVSEPTVSEPTGSPSSPPVSEALRAALLGRWLGLSRPAQEVTRLLAVGGRPTDVEVIEGVVGVLGDSSVSGVDVRQAVGEAVAAGVLGRPEGRQVWFRHPLIAEVLTSDAMAPDPGPAHSAYAKVLVDRGAPAPADVASHHELAGEWSEALRWSLTAARSAAALQGATEHLEQLQRACRLWPRVHASTDSPQEYAALLLRTSRAAQCVSQPEQALSLIDKALSLTDKASNPKQACRLLALRHRMQVEAGHLPWTEVTTSLREAEQIATSLPGTPERAIVDSLLAWTELWAGHERGRDLADTALRTARATGSPDALVPALVVDALARPEADEAMGWLLEAYELARTNGDVIEMLDAALGVHNLHLMHGDYAVALESSARIGGDLVGAGAPAAARFFLTSAANFAVCLGRWEQAEASLRPALAAADGGHREAVARSTMAILCVRRGDLTRAETQLARAAQISSTEYMGTSTYPYGRVELLMAQRRSAEALAVVEAQVGAAKGDPRDVDGFLLLAARAAADLAQDGRDRGQPEAVEVARARMADVRAAAGDPGRSFAAWDESDLVQPARRALYAAELARLEDRPDRGELWVRARDACRRAGLRWEEGLAAAHQARAALSAGRPRGETAALVRDAMAIALELGAAPLRRTVETMARAAHIPLEPVQEPPPRAPVGHSAPVGPLTARELEVLRYVVAGRSNSEIAKALFISDKTVSVHISNILRKSGTANRVDAAAWATRTTDLSS